MNTLTLHNSLSLCHLNVLKSYSSSGQGTSSRLCPGHGEWKPNDKSHRSHNNDHLGRGLLFITLFADILAWFEMFVSIANVSGVVLKRRVYTRTPFCCICEQHLNPNTCLQQPKFFQSVPTPPAPPPDSEHSKGVIPVPLTAEPGRG